MVDQYPDKKVIVCFRGAVNDKRIEFLSQLNEKADYLALVKKYNFSLYQVVKARLSLSFTFLTNYSIGVYEKLSIRKEIVSFIPLSLV